MSEIALAVLVFGGILAVVSALDSSGSVYCNVNKTSISSHRVEKTRLVEKQPTGFFKFMKKRKSYIEKYYEEEPIVNWKLVRDCCEGYEKNKFEICEPVCEKGCPNHAKCIEPNRCECTQGYISAIALKDGAHYCEPICERSCPRNARCAEPDVCKCLPGYRSELTKCVPRCSSLCPHGGWCIAPDVCECGEGYRSAAGTCVPICTTGSEGSGSGSATAAGCDNMSSTVLEAATDATIENIYISASFESTTEISEEENESVEGEVDAVSESEWDMESDSESQEDFSTRNTVGSSKCPQDYIYYRGQCRPLTFASDENDCHFQPCPEKAQCLENGTCACTEGFWIQPQLSTTATPEMDAAPSVAAVRAICVKFSEIISREAADEDEESPWMSAFFITLGFICIAGAVAFLGFKMLHRHTGQMDVEAKNELHCEYDTNDLNERPIVVY